MDLPAVAVVIANWNGRDLLGECLESLGRLEYPAERLRIVVVDNLSEDDSPGFVRQAFPEVEVVSNDANNYARANNLGVRITDTPYVALLNNDTRVDRLWLKALVAALEEHPTAAGAGSRVLFMDGRINSTGLETLEDYHWKDRGFGEEDRGQYEQREPVDGISGCSMILRRSALREAGLLDEDFEMYYEDVDLSFRLRGAGHELLYEPSSIVHHRYNASIRRSDRLGGKDRYGERNRLYVIARHYPRDLAPHLFSSRFYLQSQVRELRGFMPRLMKKWIEAGVAPRHARDLAGGLLDGKKQLLRHGRRTRALARDVERLQADKAEMLDVFHESERRLRKEIEYHRARVIETREPLEAELNAAREAYESVVAEAEQARDKAREDFMAECREKIERERWLRILLTEMAMRRVRPLDYDEQAFLEMMESAAEPGGSDQIPDDLPETPREGGAS